MVYDDYQIKSCEKSKSDMRFYFSRTILFDSNYFISYLIKKITQVELKKTTR